jgi:hypothetical protein
MSVRICDGGLDAFRNAANSDHAESVMPGIEGTESELCELLTAILRATPPPMQVLSLVRRLYLPDWLAFSGAIYQPRAAAHVRRRWPDLVIDNEPRSFSGVN